MNFRPMKEGYNPPPKNSKRPLKPPPAPPPKRKEKVDVHVYIHEK